MAELNLDYYTAKDHYSDGDIDGNTSEKWHRKANLLKTCRRKR